MLHSSVTDLYRDRWDLEVFLHEVINKCLSGRRTWVTSFGNERPATPRILTSQVGLIAEKHPRALC